jgi:phenylacetate-coenzyme A ligase PaaK-like adenylate-forming protein
MLFNEVTFANQIFKSNVHNFDELALSLFNYQYLNNSVYHQYCTLLNRHPQQVKQLADIPFLPVSFFKTQAVQTGTFEAQAIFTSSTTTGTVASKHYVKDAQLYERSFTNAFELFYGLPEQYTILALLPSYLERDGSSLVVMADALIKQSKKPLSGFYLNNTAELKQTLEKLVTEGQPILLLGVTFALLDFAAEFSLKLPNTIVMETGGMKGRRKEMIREEVHQTLKQAWQLEAIHSEYGMTELLSQAYSKGDGLFDCAPWMRLVLTDPNDPLQELPKGHTGLINIIDLANIHSCAFIQTSDIGRLHPSGLFEVLGRMDQSDVRGCNLMYL